MKRTGKLGSVHYDENLVCDLWQELTDSADAISSSLTVDHDSSSTKFESPAEFQNATQIPNRVTEFELTIESSDGDLRLSASSHGHNYVIHGEENWVRRMSDHIRDFSSEKENRLRTAFTNHRIRVFQALIFGILITTFWNKIIDLVLPFYHVSLSQTQWYIFIGLIFSILLLQFGKYIYPTVVLRRRGSQARIRKVVFILTIVGSVVGIIQGVYWII